MLALPTRRARLVGARRAGVRGHSRARSSLRRPGLSALRSLCRMRTIWRRPPHGQAGIVSVRLGTVLQLTVPHAWQMSSATAAMSRGLPEPASSPSCNLRVLSLGGLEFRAICESLTSPEQPDCPAPASAIRGPAHSAFVNFARRALEVLHRHPRVEPGAPQTAHLNKTTPRVSGRVAGGEARLSVRGVLEADAERGRRGRPQTVALAALVDSPAAGRQLANTDRYGSHLSPHSGRRGRSGLAFTRHPRGWRASAHARSAGQPSSLDPRAVAAPRRASWGGRTGDRAAGQKIRMMSRTTMAIATIAATMMYTPPGRPRPSRPSSGSPWRLTNSPFSSPQRTAIDARPAGGAAGRRSRAREPRSLPVREPDEERVPT